MESKNRAEFESFQAVYAITANDPTTPPAAKRFMKRLLFTKQ